MPPPPLKRLWLHCSSYLQKKRTEWTTKKIKFASIGVICRRTKPGEKKLSHNSTDRTFENAREQYLDELGSCEGRDQHEIPVEPHRILFGLYLAAGSALAEGKNLENLRQKGEEECVYVSGWNTREGLREKAFGVLKCLIVGERLG